MGLRMALDYFMSKSTDLSASLFEKMHVGPTQKPAVDRSIPYAPG